MVEQRLRKALSFQARTAKLPNASSALTVRTAAFVSLKAPTNATRRRIASSILVRDLKYLSTQIILYKYIVRWLASAESCSRLLTSNCMDAGTDYKGLGYDCATLVFFYSIDCACACPQYYPPLKVDSGKHAFCNNECPPACKVVQHSWRRGNHACTCQGKIVLLCRP